MEKRNLLDRVGLSDQDRILMANILDRAEKAKKRNIPAASDFLSPRQKILASDLLRLSGLRETDCVWTGGYENAERKILAAGNEAEMGHPEPPVRVIAVKPKSEKFAEKLTHRDYLGSVLALGIDRSLIGNIIVRDQGAWVFCLSSAAGLITSSLTQVRRTAVRAEVTAADIPELQPQYAALTLNVASERLDAVTAAFTGISRAQADRLFASEKVFVNGRTVTDRSFRLKEGDVLSVRGFGKAIYDGIDHETRKNRYQVRLRKLV